MTPARGASWRFNIVKTAGTDCFIPAPTAISATVLIWYGRPPAAAGRIASYTVVRRGVSADFEAPYVIALIDLEEGPRMMSQIIEADPEALAVGLSVTVDFAAWSEEITLPVFRLHPALAGDHP